MPADSPCALPFARYRFVGYDDAESRFADASRQLTVVDRGLPAVVEVRDARFVPLGPIDRRTDTRTGGLFDAAGTVVEAAVHRRGANVISGQPWRGPWPEPVATVDEPVVFLGSFFHHFGHAIYEGLARAWALARCPTDSRVLFADLVRAPSTPSLRLLLHGLGLKPERLLLPTGPLRLRHVLVPEPALVYGGIVHRELRATYHEVLERLGIADTPPTEQPLYLSRSGLGRGARRAVDEPRLESLLAAAGVRVLQPERHDLRTQLAALHAHRTVVGFWGSAFRLGYFSPRSRCTVQLSDAFPWPSALTDACLVDGDAWFVRGADRVDVSCGRSVPAAGWKNVSAVRFDVVLDTLADLGIVPRGGPRPQLDADDAARARIDGIYASARELARKNDSGALDALRGAARSAGVDGVALEAACDEAVAEIALARGAADRAIEQLTSKRAPDALTATARGLLGRAELAVGDPRGVAATHLLAAIDAGVREPVIARALTAASHPDPERVDRALRAVLDAWPEAVELRLQLAARLEARDGVVPALGLLDAAPASSDDRVALELERARLAARTADESLAAAAVAAAVAFDPTDARAMHVDAVRSLGRGDVEHALARARTACAARPHGAGHRALLGQILMAAGRLDEAERALRESLVLDPGAAGSRALLAEVLAQRCGGRAPPGRGVRCWLRQLRARASRRRDVSGSRGQRPR